MPLRHAGWTDLQGGTCRLFLADSGAPVPPSGDVGADRIIGRCGGISDPCRDVSCPAFEDCDPNDPYPETGMGRCACGRDAQANRPGVVCADNEICLAIVDGGAPACLRVCEPFAEPCFPVALPDASGSTPQGCYYLLPGLLGMACAPPTGDLGAGQSCQRPTDCAPPLTCAESAGDVHGSSMACVPYCDVFPIGGPTSTPRPYDGGSHPCPSGSVCAPLPEGIAAGLCELN